MGTKRSRTEAPAVRSETEKFIESMDGLRWLVHLDEDDMDAMLKDMVAALRAVHGRRVPLADRLRAMGLEGHRRGPSRPRPAPPAERARRLSVGRARSHTGSLNADPQTQRPDVPSAPRRGRMGHPVRRQPGSPLEL